MQVLGEQIYTVKKDQIDSHAINAPVGPFTTYLAFTLFHVD